MYPSTHLHAVRECGRHGSDESVCQTSFKIIKWRDFAVGGGGDARPPPPLLPPSDGAKSNEEGPHDRRVTLCYRQTITNNNTPYNTAAR
jgi:hypothetical protein